MRRLSRVFLCAALALGLAYVATPLPAEDPIQKTSVTFASTVDGERSLLPATLLRPTGAGPFPAIVMLHGCGGLGPNGNGAPERWASLFADQGYVVIIPDSFTPRGHRNGVCAEGPSPEMRKVNPRARSFDAYSALAYLRTLPYVDGRHVGVMGASHGAAVTLSALVEPTNPPGPLAAAKRSGFAAGVAFYPSCGETYGNWAVERQGGSGPVVRYSGIYRPVAPLLILIGQLDDWTPADQCQALTERAVADGQPVEIKVYPGAFHGFDERGPVRRLNGVHNGNKPDGHGATVGGNPAAWADSIDRATAFFAGHLKSAR